MTAVKINSTIQENKQTAFKRCPVTLLMEKIGGYWKPVILFSLLQGGKRYHELKRSIPAITEKVLIQQLKQLEEDRLIIRTMRSVLPPHVNYCLSESGKRLRPVLLAMAAWAIEENAGDPSFDFKDLGEFAGKGANESTQL